MPDQVLEFIQEDTIELVLQTAGAPGADGPVGPTGATGATGAAGQGVPVGGTTGQVLAKIDGTNYNTQWVTGGGGSGTVTSVSVTTANGVSGTVATDTTTPAISLTLGAITPSSVAAVGTVTGSNLSGTNTGDQTNISGNAATVTTNANLTGHVTSVGNSAVLGSFTVAQLNTALSDGDIATGGGSAVGTNTGDNAVNTLYSGLVSNATHTGDATGATALTVVAINGVTMSGLATGILKNTTGTGAPSIAVNSDLPAMSATVGGAVPTPPNNTTTFLRGDGTFAAPTASVSGVVRSVDFGTGEYSTTLDVVDATITANNSIQTSIVSGSSMTAEEAAIQGVTVAAVINAGVGYTLHCAAPLGAIGIIGILTEKIGV